MNNTDVCVTDFIVPLLKISRGLTFVYANICARNCVELAGKKI